MSASMALRHSGASSPKKATPTRLPLRRPVRDAMSVIENRRNKTTFARLVTQLDKNGRRPKDFAEL